MEYQKIMQDGYIMALHIVADGGNCEEKEYSLLLALFEERPDAQSGYSYLLRADTLKWELVEVQEEDISDDEAYKIIFGGDAE